ncbi:hypothetical protein SPLC1_S380070 [Arthrospira platensis C1]|nr:hypothetical protein SPLC1_S380070 [Arthrospira platensis C1]
MLIQIPPPSDSQLDCNYNTGNRPVILLYRLFRNRAKHYPHPKSGSQVGRGTLTAYCIITEKVVSDRLGYA